MSAVGKKFFLVAISLESVSFPSPSLVVKCCLWRLRVQLIFRNKIKASGLFQIISLYQPNTNVVQR